MSKQFIFHTLFLLVAAALAYLWTSSPTLSALTLQLIAVLVLLYFATSFALRKKKTTRRAVVTLDLTILTITILLLVASTDGLASPLFFTIYFLLFAVALLFETEATLVLTGVLIVFLTLLPSTNVSDLKQLAELLAVLMITPLALFTGHEHEEIVRAKKSEKKMSSRLNEQEEDTLLFLSLNLKNTLTSAIDTLSQLIPKTQVSQNKTLLTSLYQDLKALYRTAGELEKSVDHEDN